MCIQKPSKIGAMRQKRKGICLRVTILVGNGKKGGSKDREGLSDFWQGFYRLLCLRRDLRSGSQETD